MRRLEQLRIYWHSEAGPREVLRLALPLVLSTCSLTLQVFIDRVFLAWYSEVAIAAAIPSVCVLWLVLGPLWGIVAFANTFVAQYRGAGRNRRIGPAVGQALLVALVGGAAVFVLLPFSRTIFGLIGHGAEVAELEAVYFDTLVFSTMPMLAMTAASSFFGGLGRTWVVCAINVVATAVNIVLDYAMIFGHWGFPEWGIAGAGWATAIAYVVGAVMAIALVYVADKNGQYGVRVARPESAKGVSSTMSSLDINLLSPFADSGRATRGWLSIDADLIRRLLRFGGPSGLMFLIEVAAWTWFELLVGRIGTAELAATNVAFNINMVAFLPMLGLCTAAQILTGQRLGEDRPDLASRSTWSAFWLAFGYTATLGIGFLLLPEFFIAPFRWGSGGAAAVTVAASESAGWSGMVVTLLRFVAVYMLFDMGLNVFASALRGAGDTRFVMGAMLGVAVGVLGVPSYVAIGWWGGGIYLAWCFVTAYVIALGAVFFWRFQSGAWRSMRVIETSLVETDPAVCEPTGCEVG